MPIHHMLYRCPRCGHDPLDGDKGRAKCSSTGTQFEQGRGAVIIVRPSGGLPKQCTTSNLLADVERLGGPSLSGPGRAQLGEASLFGRPESRSAGPRVMMSFAGKVRCSVFRNAFRGREEELSGLRERR